MIIIPSYRQGKWSKERLSNLTLHSRISGSRWVITPSWLSGSWRSFLYSSSVYSCHLFLLYSASVRSIWFLSFIVPIFAWHVTLVSLIFLKRSAKSLQPCLTLCDPIDGSPPGPAIPGIFQARTLEWVAISSSNAWKWKVKVKSLSRVRLLATPWTAAYQAPPSMGFSRQEFWSGVPLPSPNDTLKYLLLRGLNEIINMGHLAHCLVHNKHRVN